MSIALRENSLRLAIPQRRSVTELFPVRTPIFPKGWRGWIARFAWRFVKNLSTEVKRDELSFTELRIDKGKYREAISGILFKIRDIDRKDLKYLVVGRDAFFDIQQEIADCNSVLSFPVGGKYWEQDRRGRRIFFLGLRVIYVPWLQGIALLPDLDQHKG